MVRAYSRLNGWMPPPHPLQVMAWIMVLCLTASTFGIVGASFESFTIRLAVQVVMALMIFINIAANIVVTTIDPADDAVKKKIRNHPRPGFDRGKHRHVIDENYFCNICETIIQSSSKHCRQCNKCVLDFDHHCKWLNNCIGAKNYRWFLFYVISTVLTSLSILGLSIAVFTLSFIDKESLYHIDGALTIFGIQTKDALWLGFVAFTMALAFVAAALLMHLLVFHLKILKKGMTTYTFIMEQRKKDEEKQKKKAEMAATAAAALASGTRLFSQTKKNPMAEDPLAAADGNPGTARYQMRLQRLKQLLRWRTEQSQNPTQPPGLFALNTLPHQNGLVAQDALKRKQPPEDLVLVDPSSDGLKPEPAKVPEDPRRLADSKGDVQRAITPLPPISLKPNRMPIIGGKSQASIQSSLPVGQTQSAARKKKRAGATSVQSPVPYEIMEDKENRISVSHIAATLPPDNTKSRNGGRVDSATLGAFSRHKDVPRLPPLPPVTSTSHIETGPIGLEAILHNNQTHDDLGSSWTTSSTDRREEETLKEIPLKSFPHRQNAATSALAAATVGTNRTPSGTSSASSGSILAPLQADALVKAVSTFGQSGGATITSTYVTAGRYFGQAIHGQRMKSFPSLMAGRHHESLIPITNDYESKLSQFSDSGSLSSGSKRVRFTSPKPRRK